MWETLTTTTVKGQAVTGRTLVTRPAATAADKGREESSTLRNQAVRTAGRVSTDMFQPLQEGTCPLLCNPRIRRTPPHVSGSGGKAGGVTRLWTQELTCRQMEDQPE